MRHTHDDRFYPARLAAMGRNGEIKRHARKIMGKTPAPRQAVADAAKHLGRADEKSHQREDITG
jgi:hypothetical protein